MSIIKNLIIPLIVVCVLTPLKKTSAQTDWEFDASIYMWFAGIEGTVGIANAEQQFDAKPSDLLENLEFAFPVHFEMRNPDVSLIADVLYMRLGQDVDIQVTTPHNTLTNTGEMDLDQWVLEGTFGYRISKEFEVLASLRYYDIMIGMIINDTTTSNSENWYDGYIGVRYITDFAKDWYTTIRADIGMGGSNFAWYGDAEIGYRFSKLFSLAFGYRVISLDYETGSGVHYFKYDALCHGFNLVAAFSFN